MVLFLLFFWKRGKGKLWEKFDGNWKGGEEEGVERVSSRV